MQMIITGRHCEVDADVKDIIRQRFEHLVRFESRVSRAEVTLTAVKRGFEAEGLLSVDRADRIHARAEADEMRTAVDRVVEKLGRQLRRMHSRHHEHRAPPMDELFGPASPVVEDAEGESREQETA